MSHEGHSTRERSKSRRRASSRSFLSRVGRFWSQWRVEIVLVLVFAFAVFLLVERMQIRQTLMRLARGGARWLGALVDSTLNGIVGFATSMTPSDLIGLVLIVGVGLFAVWRVRWRLVTMPRFTERRCPRCGSDLHRIHRHRADRTLNVFLPVRRYRCKNNECRWQGLRVGRREIE